MLRIPTHQAVPHCHTLFELLKNETSAIFSAPRQNRCSNVFSGDLTVGCSSARCYHYRYISYQLGIDHPARQLFNLPCCATFKQSWFLQCFERSETTISLDDNISIIFTHC